MALRNATAEQRNGDPDAYKSEVLYSAPDGSFSIVALVWRPGQVTPIHDHVTWRVFGVIQGMQCDGTDVSRIGSSVRRYYDLPVKPTPSAGR